MAKPKPKYTGPERRSGKERRAEPFWKQGRRRHYWRPVEERDIGRTIPQRIYEEARKHPEKTFSFTTEDGVKVEVISAHRLKGALVHFTTRRSGEDRRKSK